MQHEINLVRNAFMLEIWSLHEWFNTNTHFSQGATAAQSTKIPGKAREKPESSCHASIAWTAMLPGSRSLNDKGG